MCYVSRTTSQCKYDVITFTRNTKKLGNYHFCIFLPLPPIADLFLPMLVHGDSDQWFWGKFKNSDISSYALDAVRDGSGKWCVKIRYLSDGRCVVVPIKKYFEFSNCDPNRVGF